MPLEPSLASPRRSLTTSDALQFGCTAIASAAWTGQLETVKELLVQNADPSIASKVILRATARRHEPLPWNPGQNSQPLRHGTVTTRPVAGFPPTLASQFGETALDYAKYRGHSDVVTVLLAAGCRSNRP